MSLSCKANRGERKQEKFNRQKFGACLLFFITILEKLKQSLKQNLHPQLFAFLSEVDVTMGTPRATHVEAPCTGHVPVSKMESAVCMWGGKKESEGEPQSWGMEMGAAGLITGTEHSLILYKYSFRIRACPMGQALLGGPGWTQVPQVLG